MLHILKSIFILLFLLCSSNLLFSQNDTILLVDTIYLPADTIKNVNTIFVYEEANTILNNSKESKSLFSTGLAVGLNPSLDNFVTGELQFIWQYKHFFSSLYFVYNSPLSTQLSYNQQFSHFSNHIDTIKTKVDEFIQIVGKDTTVTSIYDYKYIEKTDTSYSDSSYNHTNVYRSIIFPLTFGYCKKTDKFMLGLGIGAQFRFMFPDKTNKYLQDNSFVSEETYLQTFNIDAVGQIASMQRITPHIWLFEKIGMSIPLMSDFKSENSKIYNVQANLSIGFHYYINPIY